mmetsp:Transcript_11804/g.17531  ORF Transcript_11804/g.17531 Transcript_11804/m.17531 type:complete len:389 (+) Transcript_11804:43-1209(+)
MDEMSTSSSTLGLNGNEQRSLLGFDKPLKSKQKKKYIGIVTFILIPIIVFLLCVFGITISIIIIVKSLKKRSSEIKFVAWGDWGRQGNYYQDAVADMMNRWCHEVNECNFIVSTGDNFYPDGVKSADSVEFKKSFEEIYLLDKQTYLKDNTYYMCFGNHDYKAYPTAQIQYGETHENWIIPKPYYERDIKSENGDNSLRILFVDTVPLINKYYEGGVNHSAIIEQNTKEQLSWFEDALDRATNENVFTIVVGHHPLHSLTNKNATELMDMQATIEKLMAKYHVSIYFAGHVHNLQYASVEKEDFVVYNVLTGAGSKIVPIPTKQETNMAIEIDYNKFKYAEGGFVGVQLNSDGNQLDVQYISHEYELLFEKKFKFDPQAKDKTRYQEI